MDITMFLGMLWGPVMLAVGIGIFVSRKYYVTIYRDLEKDALAVLIFGMAGMAAGIAHIYFHNVWDTIPQVVISLFGWGLLIKGAFFVIIPDVADRVGNIVIKSNLIPVAGAATMILGAYVSWFAYFA